IKGIICGLGNPGPRYAMTRHNAGFMTIDKLVENAGNNSDENVRLKKHTETYMLWEWEFSKYYETWLLVKPLTFMNRSGRAISKILSGKSIEYSKLIVIHDEVDINLGKLRIKMGGGLAGHNGLRSISNDIGTRDFVRLRFGIGRPDDGDDLAQYVLNKFAPDEFTLLKATLDRAAKAVSVFREDGLEKTRDFLST
ncbi:MAG: aminoacyl-tRNA hydrolase, partial [Desulfonatronovibrio sp.]